VETAEDAEGSQNDLAQKKFSASAPRWELCGETTSYERLNVESPVKSLFLEGDSPAVAFREGG